MELSIGEMALIVLAVIVLFGPDKLPSIARELGAGVRKMRGAVDDIKTEIMKEADNPVSELKREYEKIKESTKDLNPVESIKEEFLSLEKPKSANLQTEETLETPVLKPAEDENHTGPVSR